MIFNFEVACINLVLLESRKLEQKIPKQQSFSLLKNNKDTGNVN